MTILRWDQSQRKYYEKPAVLCWPYASLPTILSSPGEEPDLIHLHRILYCTDFSDNSEQAFDHAVSLAAEYKAELTLLHVLEGIADSADIENEIAKVMESLEKRISPETQ